ncbi:ARM REPEAT PROTEIN INTERACTING WITH [Arachis hypogaea]|nr:ARM REPEAT PROTEIN INTERACTING WITH [Arachis hypogaea]
MNMMKNQTMKVLEKNNLLAAAVFISSPLSPSGIKLAVASEIRGRVTGDARDTILAEVQEQVSILNSTFSWKESDRAAAKRATHALADLAKNGKSSVPLPRSPNVLLPSFRFLANSVVHVSSNQHLQVPPVTEEGLVQKLLPFEHEVEKVSAFALGLLATVVAAMKASESSHCFSESSNGIKVLNAKNTMQKAKEKNLKGSREKQQFSRESSITSMCVVETAGGVASPGYDVVAVVLEDHGLLNEGRIMSYICEQASCSSATPCSKSLLVFLKAQSTEVVALLFDACASWWTQGPNAILQIIKLLADSGKNLAGYFACSNVLRLDYASRSRCNSYSTKRQFKVKTVARIVESDAGKVICREAERIKPAAVVLGSRGRNLIQSVLQGSVGEYYYHHYKAAPVVIVPGKDVRDASIL